MKRNIRSISILLLLAGMMASCVPMRKYEELETKFDKLDTEHKDLKAQFQDADAKLNELTAQLADVTKLKNTLEKDYAICESSLTAMTEKYDKLNEINNELLRKLDMLRSGSEAENRKLSAELEVTRLELQRKEDELRRLELELEAKRTNLDKLQKDLEEREAKVKELTEMIALKDAKVKALQAKVKEALLAFEGKGLEIEMRNGKIYVKMEAKLLFASGSTKVGGEGKKALVELAKVLQDQKDIQIAVEGHTDTDAISSSSYPRDNWDLSVLRATSVVNIMLDNSDIDPQSITASGKSEYVPVDPADKSKNRRIEVVLVPNLDELFNVIDSE